MSREEAVNEIVRWLESQGPSRALVREELRRYYGNHDLRDGWRVEIQCREEQRKFDLLLPTTFPSDVSRVALVDRPTFGVWPHVEPDGLLCLPERLPNEAHPVEDVQLALFDAATLIEASLSGSNQDDLREEFHSYWDSMVTGNRRLVSILEPRGPSRAIAVWHGQADDVVGESTDSVRRWLSARNGVTDTRRWSPTQGLLLWLRQPLLPETYPKTAAEVLQIAEASGGSELLVELSRAEAEEGVFVVLGAETGNGVAFAAVGLRAPEAAKKGFRHLPTPTHVSRYFSPSCRVERFVVDRADPAWIHGRGRDPRQPFLRQRTVLVIGGGSIGGPISLALAAAGVGRIDIVDPQDLQWGNIGRHPLGAQCVGQNKAEALADRIRRSFPHIDHVFGHARRWEAVAATTPDLLSEADVIVSALGDWGSESALNHWHLANGRRRPIVYVWTEAHAAAGHAVAVVSTGGCLRCGFSAFGLPLMKVTEWPNATRYQEAGCGALFQPYGPVELQHTLAVQGELVLDALLGSLQSSAHRVWAASEEFVFRIGGHWTDNWRGRANGRGPVVEVMDWPKMAGCPACGQ